MRKSRNALSIKQPWADSIMDGIKIWEYRSRSTNVRSRVYIYASRKVLNLCTAVGWGAWADGGFKKNLIIGKILGSVEIVDCEKYGDGYRWRLSKPKRLKSPVKPTRHPQPVFFRPF
jgi:hypothetical protein